jgi:hypothetical protein
MSLMSFHNTHFAKWLPPENITIEKVKSFLLHSPFEEEFFIENNSQLYQVIEQLKVNIQNCNSFDMLFLIIQTHSIKVSTKEIPGDFLNSCCGDDEFFVRFAFVLLKYSHLFQHYLSTITCLTHLNQHFFLLCEIWHLLTLDIDQYMDVFDQMIEHPWVGRAFSINCYRSLEQVSSYLNKTFRQLYIECLLKIKHKYINNFFKYNSNIRQFSQCSWSDKCKENGIYSLDLEPLPVFHLKDSIECSICYEQIYEVNELPCQHLIHKQCISHWVRSQEQQRIQFTCPLCRHLITPTQTYFES